MNEQASILFNISFSFDGINAGKGELSAPHSYLRPSIYTALTRSLYTQERVELLGRQLAAITRHAYFARQTEVMKEASQLMLALPLSKELRSVAQYYQALCCKREGDFNSTYRLLEKVASEAPSFFRARVLLSIGATYFDNAEIKSAVPFFLASAQAAGDYDFQTSVTAHKMMAVVRSIYGDHQQSLADLERLIPSVRGLARHCPAFYYEFLNSYAVELGEVGRIAEAQNVCAITLASPFAAAYPEFAQTRDELAAKRTAATPSIIAVPAAPANVCSQAQVKAEPEPARARSTISLKLRRVYSHTRVLTKGMTTPRSVAVSTRMVSDWFTEATLPRGPPVHF